MWGADRLVHTTEQVLTSPQSPDDRKQRKNHTNKLQELALMLPIASKIGAKKFTKKEILLHVLHYIQFLQRSINVARASITLYTTEAGAALGGLGLTPAGSPSRRRHSTPLSSARTLKPHLRGAHRKPRKKKTSRALEYQSRAQNARRCLSLGKLKERGTPSPDQQGGKPVGLTPKHPNSSALCKSPPLPLGCMCRSSGLPNGPSPASQAQQAAENVHFLKRKQLCPRQKLELSESTESAEEAEKKAQDADPWLPAWTPEDSPNGSPLVMGPPQMDLWNMTGHPSEILGLSPSLFSSPGKMLPEQILEDNAIFEEMILGPVSSPLTYMLEAPKQETPSEVTEDPPTAHGLFQSSVSLDHCYLPLNEGSKTAGSPGSRNTGSDSDSVWRQQEGAQADPDGQLSSSEDGDYTWTPTLKPTGRKSKKGRRADKGPTKSKESQKGPCPTQPKKKCVNGFIMFCRMNRKQYIRACPGTASTAATKELAQLWRVMTQQERRPYCIKARRFSRQHNRNVKQESASSEDEEWGHPKPFYQLLAEKARRSAEREARDSQAENPAPLGPASN